MNDEDVDDDVPESSSGFENCLQDEQVITYSLLRLVQSLEIRHLRLSNTYTVVVNLPLKLI